MKKGDLRTQLKNLGYHVDGKDDCGTEVFRHGSLPTVWIARHARVVYLSDDPRWAYCYADWTKADLFKTLGALTLLPGGKTPDAPSAPIGSLKLVS